MIPARYFVVKRDGHWRVEFESVFWNGHKSQKEALQMAIEAARKTSAEGRFAEVLVQNERNVWFTEWSSHDETGGLTK